MKTYRALFEIIVESDKDLDAIKTEINRAAYHIEFDNTIVERFETAYIRDLRICECVHCKNNERKHKMKAYARSPRGTRKTKTNC